MNKKRLLCAALVATTISTMAGCKDKKQTATISDMPKGKISYPIKSDDTLVYWCPLAASISTQVTNYAETPFAKNLKKATGVNIKYEHPAQGQEGQTLELLIASGDLPDLIQTSWYMHGPDQAIDNQIILKLNDYFKDYAPNLNEFLKENPDVDNMIKTDSGSYYAFPFVRNDPILLSSQGIMIRSDWLKELGLELPETIEEWDIVLEALKTKCKIPFAMNNFLSFASGYDTYAGFYVDNNKIKYGYLDPSFKDFVAKLAEWYKKGYIDKNYAIADGKMRNSNMLNGVSAITYGPGGGTMGVMLTEMSGKNFDLAAVKFPSAKKGEKPKFSVSELKYGLSSVAITSTCKNPVLAARFLDYGYSEEGHMLYNFGIKDDDYKLDGDYPKYTDKITNTSDGHSMAEKLTLNCQASQSGPFVQDKRYIEQYYALPQQKEALNKWSDSDYSKYQIPQITMTTDEANEYSSIIAEIDTYVEESLSDFIVGAKSIDEFDNFVETIKSMGIDKAIKFQQKAYERFLNR